jgi:hypothetical protein
LFRGASQPREQKVVVLGAPVAGWEERLRGKIGGSKEEKGRSTGRRESRGSVFDRLGRREGGGRSR